MNLPIFITQKIIFNKQKSFSRFITFISVMAIAISIAIMVVAMSFINGFQQTIRDKAYSFWGHIRIQRFGHVNSQEETDTVNVANMAMNKQLASFSDIHFYVPYAQKYGVLISEYSMNGILFKGYNKQFDTLYFKKFLVQGRWLKFNQNDSSDYVKEIVISKIIANKLKLDIGASLIANFIDSNQTQRKRKLKIVGFFKTGFEEYDLNFAFVDLKLIQKLNSNNPQKIDGFEVYVKKTENLKEVNLNIYENIPSEWNTQTIYELLPGLFSWLDLLDVNKWVLIIILGFIAFINIVAGIITFALERSRMIGILKTMGMSNFNIQLIFVCYSTYISMKGVLIGNLIGIALCATQYYFGIIKLNETTYFIEQAPINIHLLQMLAIIFISITVCFVLLIFSSYFINKLNPIKSINIQS